MRVAIVGSREYPNPKVVEAYVWNMPRENVIVSGGARGVDSIAVAKAKSLGMDTVVYEPDWEGRGRGAGLERNTTIVENCDRVIAFWDGKSRGTMDTVRKARATGKPVTVVNVHGIEIPEDDKP